MSYLVLARKYRPQTFQEMIGQEHITDLLKRAISANRMAHAFLFCGPRGIGKTSCARILAKSLNCQKGPTIEPCGECPACREIAQGTSFDVLEIDGASNRGIDEIRALRENVKFAPSYGRYKIYIVDEVHMLTSEAFNALLKTLEEPPTHVKFIFATTAINKVPSTIISRCQRFDFRRISVPLIVETLNAICKKEKFKIDPEALFAVAKAAQGSLRDALSILDQLSAWSERGIQAEDVFSMLGMVETQLLFELTDHLAQKNCAEALKTLDKIIEQGKDIKQLSKDLTEHFRNLMIIKVGGKTLGGLVDYPVAIKDMLLVQTEKFTLKEILNAIEVFIDSQEVSRVMESLRMPLEVAFAKLTYQGENIRSEKTPAATMVTSPKPAVGTSMPSSDLNKYSPMDVLKNQKGLIDFSIETPPENIPDKEVGEEVSASSQDDAPLDLEKVKRSWDAITYAISREKMSVATYLQEGSPYDLKDSTLTIGFSKEAQFQKESLSDNHILRLVERVFSEKMRTMIKVELRTIENYKPQEDEPLVKSALDTFKGKVISKWHKE